MSDQGKAARANDVQIGGDHYRKRAIQHWDFVIANRIPYMEAQVMKYTFRWQDKAGLSDLRKARHFLDKLIEVEEERLREAVRIAEQLDNAGEPIPHEFRALFDREGVVINDPRLKPPAAARPSRAVAKPATAADFLPAADGVPGAAGASLLTVNEAREQEGLAPVPAVPAWAAGITPPHGFGIGTLAGEFICKDCGRSVFVREGGAFREVSCDCLP